MSIWVNQGPCSVLVFLTGACEGTLSCSTCHLIFSQKEMDKLNLEEPTDEELDMLDLAFGLTDT
jgi:ferredoxin